MVYVTWTRPFISEMVCHPWAKTCYYQPASQIWSLCLHSLRRHEKRYKMSKMGWFGLVRVTQGRWKYTVLQRAYKFLLALPSNNVPMLHFFVDTARYSSKIADRNLSYLYLVPRCGWPRWHFAEIFGTRKLECLGYRTVLFINIILCLPVLVR